MATREATSTETITIEYEDAGDGWITAQVLETPGAISQGRTYAEAKANVLDALRELEGPPRSGSDRSGEDDFGFAWVTRVKGGVHDVWGRVEDWRRPRTPR
jgi:hypothetical protein